MRKVTLKKLEFQKGRNGEALGYGYTCGRGCVPLQKWHPSTHVYEGYAFYAVACHFRTHLNLNVFAGPWHIQDGDAVALRGIVSDLVGTSHSRLSVP